MRTSHHTRLADAMEEIMQAKADFLHAQGLVPNLLIIGPGLPVEIQNKKDILGMRVVVNDMATEDITVAYMK